LTDVSRISEQSVQDNPSREIVLAIVNLAKVGPDLREHGEQISIDTQDSLDQIESVVRARYIP